MSIATVAVKKFINAPEDVLAEALAGIAAAHPGLAVDTTDKVITRDGPETRAPWEPRRATRQRTLRKRKSHEREIDK